MSIRKRSAAAMLAVMLLCALCISSVIAGEKQRMPGEAVTLLFTHDMHSHLDSFQAAGARIGGFGRMKTVVDDRRDRNPATFLFDGGDFSMGTLYQTVYETKAAELTMMGRMGYDAVTFGNHEFDYRSAGVANMLHSAIENAKADTDLQLPQFVTANIDWDKNTTEDNKLVKNALDDYGSTPYTVVERGGARVGVYGVLGEDADACAPESGLNFDGIVETSKKMVKELEKENVDMIVCLSHSGTNEDPDKSEDEILAKEVPEIDVIVSGHTHTELKDYIKAGDTYIVSAGSYGENLGELEMKQGEDGRWKVDEYTLNRLDGSVAEDAAVVSELKKYKEMVDEQYLSRFGYTFDQTLADNDVAFTQMDRFALEHTEDPLGSIIADSYVYAVEQAEGEAYEKVYAAFTASGIVRDTFQKGKLTVSDAFNISSLGIGADRVPGYPLVSVYLTGAELKTVAEIDVSISPVMTTAQLYPSGMSWTYNPRRLILNRVTDARFVTHVPFTGGTETEEIKDDQLYRVAAGLYCAQMLGAVEDQSKGLLKITPKDREGNEIKDFETFIIHDENGAELKEWYALASYLESFEKNSDGVAQVPAHYAGADGRKVEVNSGNIVDLVKNPNKFALCVYGLILLLVILAVLAVGFIRKRRKRKKNMIY